MFPRTFFIAVIILIMGMPLLAQNDQPVHPSLIGEGTFIGVSKPLRDIPPLTEKETQELKARADTKILNKKLIINDYPFSETALPKGPDAAWQKTMGTSVESKAPIVNFDAQSSPYYPPDCNGTAGPNHYMQTVNTTYAIYSKTGTLLAGPTNMNLLFGSVAGANCNDGDPLVQYDEMADRWVAVEFSLCGSTDLMLIAVSTTNDPTGTWYQYSFDVDDMPDYEKLGIWQDGYYMAMNNSSSKDMYVFERSVMLTGGASPKMVAFDNPWRPVTGSVSIVPPIDNDGLAAPAGSPGLFIGLNDDAVGGGSDQLWIIELAVNWVTTASSTLNRVQQIDVTPFDSNLGSGWNNIAQQGTTQMLMANPYMIMDAPQYRNFGTYQTIVCCHTVDVDNTNHAGIRWYELRKTPPSTNWVIRQQNSYAPDAHSRWMGSIMLNANNKIGLGYSVSSSTMLPAIRYTGQSAGAYASASGIMDVPEENIFNSVTFQSTYNRWGDYSLMQVDPVDNETFWYTTEYIGASGSRKTRVASFKIGNAPIAITLDATAVTATTATLNGSVNPNTFATSYNFQWGTTVSYGNTTTVTALGNGNTAIAVNVPITGLTPGTTYHFRVVATNSDGTTNGNDLTFTPGGAVVTTTAASAITLSGATSGGNVTSDGGSAITARGVCWATTANPIATGNHTTDGSGLGSFASSITGLASNTLYHVRAYATNANGTFYGNDLTFTTLCGVISSFPWTEGFENGGAIPGCWSQAQVNSSGINWTFITGNGGSAPGAAHTGTYNACLKDATTADNKTQLISPPINLNLITSPTLTFWHTQALWSPDQDILTVYYRTSATGTWTQLATYTSSISTWTQETIILPNSSTEYYLNFEGNAKYGYGVCVDDVSITGSTPNSLTVTPANQNVSAASGTTPFVVTTSAAWTATSDAAWCTVTPSGTGNGTLTATYTLNAGVSRVANITVAAPGATSVVVTVTQTGAAPTLSVTPSNQNVTAPAGNTSFTVTSNSAWTVSSNAAWCTVTPSGNGNGTITATYTQNTLLTSRVANVTVTVVGLTPIVVTVTQAAGSATLSVTPANQNVSAVAGNTNFTVTSNSPWTSSSDAAWCTVTPSGTGNGTIIANYTANTLLTSRVATITVTVTGLTPVVVTVTQSGSAPTLSVTPANQNVTDVAGNTSFAVASNSAWAVTSDASWCTVTPSGSGNGTIAAAYTLNTLLTSRVANVTVTVAGLTPIVVTVTQAASPPTLNVTPININVPATAGTANYTVTTNSPWTATYGANWCVVTPSGPGSGTLVATYEANPTLDQRISYMVVYVPGAPNANISLTQSGGSPFLSVDPHIQNVGVTAGTTNFAVSSNLPWTVTSNSTWCNVTPSGNNNGTIVATFSENTFAATRTATIMVNPVGAPPVTVTVVQAAPAPFLSVTPSTRTVTDPAGVTTFDISSNSNWTCSSDANWCQVTPSGSGIGPISASYSQNLTMVIRTANILISAAGITPVNVQVVQLPSFVSLNEVPQSNILLYPNPTNGLFVISSASLETVEMNVAIIDAKGKTIFKRLYRGSSSYTIDLSQAARGNYYVKIDTGEKNHVMKIVVQ